MPEETPEETLIRKMLEIAKHLDFMEMPAYAKMITQAIQEYQLKTKSIQQQ